MPLDLTEIEEQLGSAETTTAKALAAVEAVHTTAKDGFTEYTNLLGSAAMAIQILPHDGKLDGGREDSAVSVPSESRDEIPKESISALESKIAAAASGLIAARRLFSLAKQSGKTLDKTKASELSDKMAAIDQQLIQLRSKYSQVSVKSLKMWVRAREALSGARVDGLANRLTAVAAEQVQQSSDLKSADDTLQQHSSELQRALERIGCVEEELALLVQSANQQSTRDQVASLQANLQQLSSLVHKLQDGAALRDPNASSGALMKQIDEDRRCLELANKAVKQVQTQLTGITRELKQLQDQLLVVDALKCQVAQHETDLQQLRADKAALEQRLSSTAAQLGDVTDMMLRRIEILEQRPHEATLDAARSAFEPLSLLSQQLELCCAAWLAATTEGRESPREHSLASSVDLVVQTLKQSIESKWSAYSGAVSTVSGPLGWQESRVAPSDGEELGGLTTASSGPSGATETIIEGLFVGKHSLTSSFVLLTLLGSAIGGIEGVISSKLPAGDAAELTVAITRELAANLLESGTLTNDLDRVRAAFLQLAASRQGTALDSNETALGRVACVACNRPASALAPPQRPHTKTLRSSPEPNLTMSTQKPPRRPKSAAPVLRRARAGTRDSDSRDSSPTSQHHEGDSHFSLGGGFLVKPRRHGVSYSAQTSPEIDLYHKYESMRQTVKAPSARPLSAQFDSYGRPSCNSGLPPGKIRHMAPSPGHSGMTLEQSRRVQSYGGSARRQQGGVITTQGVHLGIELPEARDVELGTSAFALPTIWTAGQLLPPSESPSNRPHDPVLLSPEGSDTVFGGRQLLKSKSHRVTAARSATSSGLGKVTGWTRGDQEVDS